MKKTISIIIVSVLLLGLITPLAIVLAEPINTITIKSDGSIDPVFAPVSTVDGITYILTSDFEGAILIEKNDIIFDGLNHILTGMETEYGVFISEGNRIVV
ncbi:MAG: hypothetical protein GX638_16765, partial [Crenarchaeota archaeon]|nr:hypothetical protein [Thermoproteota archaeon]